MKTKIIIILLLANLINYKGFTQCSQIGFVASKTKLPLNSISPVFCTDSIYIRSKRTSFYDIPGELPINSGYIAPGLTLTMTQLDANSWFENSAEFFADGVAFAKISPSAGANIWNVTGQFLSSKKLYSLRWCDISATGSFTYEFKDNATGTILTSGIFDHNSTGKQCFDITIGYLKGNAKFTGPGITDYSDGTASFNPVKAGVGIHTITYCWDNTMGCSSCESQDIEVQGPTANAGPDQIICEGESISIGGFPSAVGGDGNYSYKWTPVTGLNNNKIANPTASPVNTTTYTITVTDNFGKGCSSTDNMILTVKDLPTLSLNNNIINLCNGDTAQLLANGADTYKWTPALGLDNINIANPIAFPSVTTTYSVTGTTNGCSKVLNAVINVNIPPSVSFVTTSANCGKADGSVKTTVSSGTAPFTFIWDTSPPLTTADLNNIKAGTYSLTVTDANGCSVLSTAIVGSTDSPFISLLSLKDETCSYANGMIDINITGGVAPYSYLWSNGSTTKKIENLSAGVYSVTATDDKGCQDIKVFDIINYPNPVLNIVNITDENCGQSDGAITVNASNGTPPYSFLWSNNNNSDQISNLSSGNYTVTVTDNKGCNDTEIYTVKTVSGPSLTMILKDNEYCSQSNGSVTVTVKDGTAPYNYIWNNNLTTAQIDNLVAGKYKVTVSDASNCSSIDSITVLNIPPPIINLIKITDETCSLANGSIEIEAFGGTGVLSYSWNTVPPQNNSKAINLNKGEYVVNIFDAKECNNSDTFKINNIPGPKINIVKISDEICSLSNAKAIVIADSGTAPYTYRWNSDPPQLSDSLSNVKAGKYQVTVTDQNSCTAIDSIFFTNIPPPIVDIKTIDAHCNQKDGQIIVTVKGGNGKYNFNWLPDSLKGKDSLINIASGTYILNLSDSLCNVLNTITVNNLPGPNADFIHSPKIVNTNDGRCVFMDKSSGSVVSWIWKFGEGSISNEKNPEFFYNNPGNYPVSLIVRDNFGCYDSVIKIITVKDIVNIFIPNSFSPDDDGLNDLFRPVGITSTPEIYQLYIYDRWGRLAYYSENYLEGWDGTNRGKIITNGIFVYKLIIKTENETQKKIIGNITVLR